MNPCFRRVSLTSLARMMCVSSSFCESSLPLLFTVLTREKDPVVSYFYNYFIRLNFLAIDSIKFSHIIS